MRKLRWALAARFEWLSVMFDRIARVIEPEVDPGLTLSDMISNIDPLETPLSRALIK